MTAAKIIVIRRRQDYSPRVVSATLEVQNLLKVFIVLRLPFSFLFLGGFGAVLGESGVDGQILGFFCLLGLLVFLGVVSIILACRRRGALWLAGLLVALEVIGGVLLLGVGETEGWIVGNVVARCCAFLLLWAAPNALILYKARGLFVKPVKEKPGL